MRSDAYSQRSTNPIRVMPGLVPGIHVLRPRVEKTWMAGTRPGHDEGTLGLADAGSNG